MEGVWTLLNGMHSFRRLNFGTQVLSKEVDRLSREVSQVLSSNRTKVGLGRTLRSGSWISQGWEGCQRAALLTFDFQWPLDYL